MVNASDKTSSVQITQQNFFDLGVWLSDEQNYQPEQLARLQNEEFYLALISLANTHWLIAPLANKLKSSEVWLLLPNQLQEYLTELEDVFLKRSEAIKKETISVCEILTKNNIEVLILKGAASLFNGVTSPISNRFMSDIDLLVSEQQQEESFLLLTQNHYKQKNAPLDLHGKEHHHAPALIREFGICYVELHKHALKKSSQTVLNTHEVWQQASPLKLTEHLTVNQASPTQQIIITIAHSEISDNSFRDKKIELRQLLTLCQISQYYKERINWKIIKQHFTDANKLPVLHASLYSAYKWFNLITPITDTNNKAAKLHFELCLSQYIKRQGADSSFSKIKSIFLGYDKEKIHSIYGKEGVFPLFNGRIKHLTRHFKILLLSPHFKNLIKRYFK